MLDVVIVGAGPAGLSAALILGRCRRKVLVCDNGKPRNRVSKRVSGFLTRDGMPPAELRRVGREQLAPYDSVEVRDVTVIDAQCRDYGFDVQLEDGTRLEARKLLLATGVIDDLPPIDGAEAFYGGAFTTALTATDGSCATSRSPSMAAASRRRALRWN